MPAAVTIDVTWRDREPLEALNKLIAERQRLMTQEMPRDAVVATAIQVVRSLRAGTSQAKKKANDSTYTITDTGWVRGYAGSGGRVYHFAPRTSAAPHAGQVRGIHPVNLAGPKYEPGRHAAVWKIEPVYAKGWTWSKNRHKGCWYVYAYTIDVARKWARERMSRYLSKYSGLARAALGFAMAKLSTGQKAYVAESGALRLAGRVTNVRALGGSGNFSIRVEDGLEYARLAVRKGGMTVELAMQKAANSISGYLRKKFGEYALDPSVRHPFPDIAHGGSLRR